MSFDGGAYVRAAEKARERRDKRDAHRAQLAVRASREAHRFLVRAQRAETRALAAKHRVGSGDDDRQVRVAAEVADVERACELAERASRGAYACARAKDLRGALRFRAVAESAAVDAERHRDNAVREAS